MRCKAPESAAQLALDLPPGDDAAQEHFAHPPKARRKSRPDVSSPAIQLDTMVATLESHPDFRVLRRLQHHEVYRDKVAARELVGVYVDCETEGLSLEDKIIEIGLVRFAYDPDDGEILRLLSPTTGYSAFEDPGRPLSDEIKRLTGIDDNDVRNQNFDDREIESLISDAHLVIAHNAGFDRPRFEKRFPFFSSKRWACSFKDIAWTEHGVPSAKLDYLAYVFGFFFDGHRAVNDCFAALEVLGKGFPETGEPVMRSLLENARKDTWRHFANPARFQNDQFRALGYKWCGKERAQSWYKDYADQASAESARQSIKDSLREHALLTPLAAPA